MKQTGVLTIDQGQCGMAAHREEDQSKGMTRSWVSFLENRFIGVHSFAYCMVMTDQCAKEASPHHA